MALNVAPFEPDFVLVIIPDNDKLDAVIIPALTLPRLTLGLPASA